MPVSYAMRKLANVLPPDAVLDVVPPEPDVLVFFPLLPHADAIFEFFAALGVEQVGFNVEEAEAAHGTSSLAATAAVGELRAFTIGQIVEFERAAFTQGLAWARGA